MTLEVNRIREWNEEWIMHTMNGYRWVNKNGWRENNKVL